MLDLLQHLAWRGTGPRALDSVSKHGMTIIIQIARIAIFPVGDLSSYVHDVMIPVDEAFLCTWFGKALF